MTLGDTGVDILEVRDAIDIFLQSRFGAEHEFSEGGPETQTTMLKLRDGRCVRVEVSLFADDGSRETVLSREGTRSLYDIFVQLRLHQNTGTAGLDNVIAELRTILHKREPTNNFAELFDVK